MADNSSFTRRVKREIFEVLDEGRHCRLALAMAIVGWAYEVEGGRLRALGDSLMPARKLADLMERDFGGGLNDGGAIAKLLAATGGGAFSPPVVKAACCKRAYIRGAFLCGGYVADPEKACHLEFAAAPGRDADGLVGLLGFFGLSPGRVTRKGRGVLYFKEGEQVGEALNIIGAGLGYMEYENSRVSKGVNNNINRLANCEAANADKLVAASVRQVEGIRKIERLIGLGALAPKLEETARARLQYPTLPLSEIAAKLKGPVSKSGLNHRLARIAQIAEELGNEREDDHRGGTGGRAGGGAVGTDGGAL